MNSRPLAGLLLVSALTIGLADVANAQLSERTIPYSGFLEEDGQPFEGFATVEFVITDEELIDAILSETHEDVPFTQGRFSVLIGSVNGLPVDVFIHPQLFLQVIVNGRPIGIPQPLPKTVRAIGHAPYLSAYSGEVFPNVPGVRLESGETDLMVQSDGNTGVLYLGPYTGTNPPPSPWPIIARNNMAIWGDSQVGGDLTVNGLINGVSVGSTAPQSAGYDISCVAADVRQDGSERQNWSPFACCRLDRDTGKVRCQERYEATQSNNTYSEGEWRKFIKAPWNAEPDAKPPYSLSCSHDNRDEFTTSSLSPRIRCCRVDVTGEVKCKHTRGERGGGYTDTIFRFDWTEGVSDPPSQAWED